MIQYCKMNVRFDQKRAAVTSIYSNHSETEFLLKPEEFVTYDIEDCKWLGHIYGKVKTPEGSRMFSTGLSRSYAVVECNDSKLSADYLRVNSDRGCMDGLQIRSSMHIEEKWLDWRITLENTLKDKIEIEELDIPLLMNQYFRGDNSFKYEKCVMRHTCIVGASSYVYWEKSNGSGPVLLMAAVDGTSLEAFRREDHPAFRTVEGIPGAFEGLFCVCPVGAGVEHPMGKTQTLILEEGAKKIFSFRFALLASERDINQALKEWDLLSLEAVPGIVAPVCEKIKTRIYWNGDGLEVRPCSLEDKAKIFAAGTSEYIAEIELGGCGVREIEIFYGKNRSVFSFFGIEPIQSIIDEHAAFIARNHFETDQEDCCYHAFLMWDMVHKRRVNSSFNPYFENWWAGGSDEVGLVSGLFLSEKNVYRPVDEELHKLDKYVQDFILERLTEQPGYRVHRMVPWYTMFEPWAGKGADDVWRAYNYVHVINIVFNMYRIQKIYQYPFLKNCTEYLEMAYQYTKAMFHYWMFPDSVGATEYGNMGEMTLPLYLDKALKEEGFKEEAKELAAIFEQKAAFFSERRYPFGSEMAYDSTAYEAVYAYGKRIGNKKLMKCSADAALGNRGRQPVWYLYFTDVRGAGDSSWNVSYMTQLGAWPIWDWAVRSGNEGTDWVLAYYGAYLSGWQIYNSGGCWSSDKENKGATGWLIEGFAGRMNGQIVEKGFPYKNGVVALSGGAELGYFGALRSACSILMKHLSVGITGLGCGCQIDNNKIVISPKDGLQMRFYDLLHGWSIEIERDFMELITIQEKENTLIINITIQNYTKDVHTTILNITDSKNHTEKKYQVPVNNDKEIFSLEIETAI